MLFFFLAFFFVSCAKKITQIKETGKLYPDVVVQQGFSYFNVSLDLLFLDLDDNTNLNIILIPYVAGLNMYVGLFDGLETYPTLTSCYSTSQANDDPKPNGKCMHGENYYFSSISFNKTDPYFKTRPTDKNLKISVYYPHWQKHNYKYESIPFVVYVSKMTTQHFWRNLKPNVPVINEITHSMEFDYYDFFLTSENDLQAVVTPVTTDVDPDVFVSSCDLRPNFGTPHDQRYLGISDNFDVLSPKVSDGKPLYNCSKCSWGMSIASILHHNFFYSTYWEEKPTKPEDRLETLLYEGIELGGKVEVHEFNYYKFFLPKEISPTSPNRLTVTLFNIQDWGDPDMYIIGPNSTLTGKPSPSNCEFCDSAQFGSDEFVLDDPLPGYYHVAVHGYEESKYLISFMKEGSIVVNNNDPIEMVAKPGDRLFFRFINQQPENAILININAEDNAKLEMYLTYKSSSSLVQPFPSPEYKDAVGSKGDDGMSLFYYYPSKTKRGSYFFSIYNNGLTNQNLTIEIVTNQTHVILRDGAMLFNQKIYKDEMLYYVFQYDDLKVNWTATSSFNFIVSPQTDYADIDLFISTLNHFPNSAKNSEWQSNNWLTDSITIYMDKKLVRHPTFYIGVKGNPWQDVNYFTIEGYISPSETEVLVDKIYTDVVKQSEYKHFVLNLRSHSNIEFILAKQDTSDQIKFYVNRKSQSNYFPSRHQYNYESSSFVEEYVDLLRAEADTYFISVYGEQLMDTTGQAKFALMVSLGTRTLMVDMQTIEILQEAGKEETIEVQMADQERVLFSLPLFYGDVAVYVCMNESKECMIKHNNYDFMIHKWPHMSVIIDKDMYPGFVNFNKWRFIIKAFVDSNYLVSIDTYHKNIETEVVFGGELFPEEPKVISLESTKGYFLKYTFLVDSEFWSNEPADEKWIIELRDVKGTVGCYVTQDWNINPTHDANTWNFQVSHDSIRFVIDNDCSKAICLRKGYVFFTLINLNTFIPAELVLNVYPYNSDQVLFQDIAYEDTFTFEKRYFQSAAVKNFGKTPLSDEGMIIAESCGEKLAPNIYLNVQELNKPDVPHQPSPAYARVRSYSDRSVDQLGSVRQQAVITNFEKPEVYYYLVESVDDENEAAVFVTSLKNNSRPVPLSFSLSYNNGGDLEVYIPIALPPSRFDDHPIDYEVYLRELDRDKINSGINFDTPCAIKRTGTFLRAYNKSTTPLRIISGYESLVIELKRTTDFNTAKVYKISAIVKDTRTQISEAYSSLWIVDGTLWQEYDYHHFTPDGPPKKGSGLSPFAIVMIVLAVLCCCCCFCCLLAFAVILVIVLIVGAIFGGGATVFSGISKRGAGRYTSLGNDYYGGGELDDGKSINKGDNLAPTGAYGTL